MRRLAVVFVVICTLAIAGFFAFRAGLIVQADQKAQALYLSQRTDLEGEALVKALTVAVHDAFRGKHEVADTTLYGRLRPYLTSRHLPEFVRVPEGAIDTLNPTGWCGNASRMLRFLLAQRGIQSRQWNMVGPNFGHVAVVADLPNGQSALVDGFYGVVAESPDGMLLDPFEAQKRSTDAAFKAIAEDSNLDFYKRFDEVMMAAQGERLNIIADIPPLENGRLVLGEINRQAGDVKAATLKNRLSPQWDYIGHKRDRSWVRHLRATEPVRITFTLTEDLYDGVLTANKEPEITGKTLVWTLNANEELVFTDGSAKASLLRMRSYVPVDQIVIETLE